MYPLLLICLIGQIAGSIVELSELTEEPGTIQGHIYIPVTETTNGWKVILTFSGPVNNLDVKSADVFSHSSALKTFTIVNKPEDGVRHPGDKLQLEFFGNFTGQAPTSATAQLINLGIDLFSPPTAPPNRDGTKYNLNEVLQKSILFYEAQRSGKLPANSRIPWRGDSALNDSGDNDEDLTGGWYDAGDHVKFVFPQAGAVTLLAWGLSEFKDAYDSAQQLLYMYDCLRWPLTFLMKCHREPNKLYVQVGNGSIDHQYWGRPENMTMPRPAILADETHPASDVAGEVAAAFAAGYLVFRSHDALFASELLRHSKELFSFAEKYLATYSISLPETRLFYGSSGYRDELAWAGAWLYKATGDPHYLRTAEASYPSGPAWELSWDNKAPAAMVLLYNLTQKDLYRLDLEATMREWLPGGRVVYTPQGLAFGNKWGSLRQAANMALIALMASMQGINSTEYRKWAENQLNYMLGDSGRSFVVGFGHNPPTHSHHRASSCPLWPAPCTIYNLRAEPPNPHILFGALVGGPGDNDDYTDSRQDYVRNEVAVDYNAGFQSAIAGLKAMYTRGIMP